MIVENAEDSYTMEDTRKFLPTEADFNNNNLDAKVKKFAGLSKEEVLQYSTDPSWVKLRWILFILFWFVWFALLGAVIGIVFMTPSCAPKPKLDWWQKEVVYQLDVHSFKDSNGDMLGDLNGVVEKMDYFKELGVDAICLKSNVLNAEKPKEFGPAMLTDMTLKDLKKTFKMNDVHLILDIPFSVVSNDKSVLSFWLKEIADGVRITEIPDGADKEAIQNWMDVAKEVGDETFEKKFISLDKFPIDTLISEDQENQPSIIQRPLYAQNVFTSKSDTQTFLGGLQTLFDESPNVWSGFSTGSFDTPRISKIFTDKKQLHVAHGISLLLKGTPFVLYGDELEANHKSEQPLMKWNNAINCGFSTKNTTLGVTNCENSVQDSFSHGAGQNLIRMYRQLSKLRKEPSFAWGRVRIETEKCESLVSFVREAEGFDGYLVAANFNVAKNAGSTNFASVHDIPRNGTVVFFYSDSEGSRNEFRIGLEVITEQILLRSGELLVVKFDKRPRNEF